MFYVDQSTQKRYYIGTPFDYNERQYTKAGATHAKFMELGFTQVLPQGRPDDRFNIVSGPNADGSYDSTPRDLVNTQLSFVQQQLQQAQQLLTASDWLYIRAGEANAAAVPPSVQTERDAVRSVMDTNCDLICATSSIPELEALIKEPAQVAEDPAAEVRVMVDNPQPHLEPYPELDTAALLARELISAAD